MSPLSFIFSVCSHLYPHFWNVLQLDVGLLGVGLLASWLFSNLTSLCHYSTFWEIYFDLLLSFVFSSMFFSP